MEIQFNVKEISLDTFAVNNLTNNLPKDFISRFDIHFQEIIVASAQTIKITILVNIYYDQNENSRIGTIQTSTVYEILNFDILIASPEILDYFIPNVLGISISTTRGMLVTRGAGTALEHFILPIINPKELFEELNNANRAERLITKANNYIQLNNIPKAIGFYSQVIKDDPNNLEALFNRSLLNYKNQKYNLVISDLNKFIHLNPNVFQAYLRRGVSYFQLNDFAKAIEDFNKALEIDSSNPEGYFNRALAAMSLGQIEIALEDYTKAINIEPKNAIFYTNRGILYYEQKDFTKAIEDFNKALEIDSLNPEIYYNRGVIYENLNKHNDAFKDFTRALELDSSNIYALNARANNYRLQKKYKLALADANRALQINPNFSTVYGTIAEVYAEQNNSNLFYEYLELALSKGFPISKYLKDRAYDGYRNEDKFITLLHKYEKV